MGETLGPEAYRALYEHSPDAVLFTVPDGRVLAANPAACEMFQMSEDELCARGRQGLADGTDDRWGPMLAERGRTGRVRGVARMIRGDGTPIDAEISARIFTDANGDERTCTIVRDITDRVTLERALLDMSLRLRELAITDELTGLRNRRGFVEVASQILELADRQQASVQLLFLDVDGMKELNDSRGHAAGDAGLKAVAQTLNDVLRHADVVARVGGDEFVALMVGPAEWECESIERRLREHLHATRTVAAVGQPVEVSVGWSERAPCESTTVEELLKYADGVMYQAKAAREKS